jgi:hypothetical protein
MNELPLYQRISNAVSIWGFASSVVTHFVSIFLESAVAKKTLAPSTIDWSVPLGYCAFALLMIAVVSWAISFIGQHAPRRAPVRQSSTLPPRTIAVKNARQGQIERILEDSQAGHLSDWMVSNDHRWNDSIAAYDAVIAIWNDYAGAYETATTYSHRSNLWPKFVDEFGGKLLNALTVFQHKVSDVVTGFDSAPWNKKKP